MTAQQLREAFPWGSAPRCPTEKPPELLRGPFRGWMSGDAKMQNAPPLMRQDQQHVEHLEPDGRYRKEVDRNHGLHMVLQEGSPGLGGRVVAAHQVLAHTRLANVDAELEQLSVNTTLHHRGITS